MNEHFSDLVHNGILVCLYGQLMILGIFNILNLKARNIILGVTCCLLAMSFIYTIYWPVLSSSILGNIILGGYKHLFLPSLIYLYIALIDQEKFRRILILHLTIPMGIHFTYLILKLCVGQLYDTHIYAIVGMMNAFIFLSYTFYVFKGLNLFIRLKEKLLPSIYNRYRMYYIVMIGYGLLLVSKALMPYFLNGSDVAATSSFLSQDIFVWLAIIINMGVLIFSFVESPRLKPLLFGDKIYTGYDSIKNDDQLKNFITNIFEKNKSYTDHNFNLKYVLAKHYVNEKEFRLYLKKQYGYTLLEFINRYRIKEFKYQLTLPENAHYSLMGIAQKVGFNSKATFYRNFKNVEGITPNAYWKNQKSMDVL